MLKEFLNYVKEIQNCHIIVCTPLKKQESIYILYAYLCYVSVLFKFFFCLFLISKTINILSYTVKNSKKAKQEQTTFNHNL